MAMQYRKSKSLGKGTRLNVSHRGVGVSQKVGPLSVSSRGNMSLKLAPGVHYRSRGKNAGAIAAVFMLGAALFMFMWALMVWMAKLMWISILYMWAFTVWTAKWAYYGGQKLFTFGRTRVDEYQAAKGVAADESNSAHRGPSDVI